MNFSAACVIIIYGEVINRGKSEYDYIKNIIRRNYFMCGIVGYVGQRDCTDVLMQGLEKLEYRGYDSAGIAVFEKTGIKTVKTKGKLADMRHKLDIEGSPVGHCGIGAHQVGDPRRAERHQLTPAHKRKGHDRTQRNNRELHRTQGVSDRKGIHLHFPDGYRGSRMPAGLLLFREEPAPRHH